MSRIVPFENMGGTGDAILFSHANGYPPRAYQQFIDQLTPHFKVIAPVHRPLWGPQHQPSDITSWHNLANDLEHFIQQRNLPKIIMVGHSLGAVASMFAETNAPHLIKGLVLIEPVFLSDTSVALSRAAGGSNPMVKTALNRRNVWENRDDAFEHFRKKEVFSQWSDDALQDYVMYGMIPTGVDDEVTLAYSREWEARMYGIPPRVWKRLSTVKARVMGIKGETSDVITRGNWRKWGNMRKEDHLVEIQGAGHMIPMEKPAELAAQMIPFIKEVYAQPDEMVETEE